MKVTLIVKTIEGATDKLRGFDDAITSKYNLTISILMGAVNWHATAVLQR
jgi:hypothetical protein